MPSPSDAQLVEMVREGPLYSTESRLVGIIDRMAEVRIGWYEAKPLTLAVRVDISVLGISATRYWRCDAGDRERHCGRAWYCNDTQGSLPQNEADLAKLLNRLVTSHPELSKLADHYGIDSA